MNYCINSSNNVYTVYLRLPEIQLIERSIKRLVLRDNNKITIYLNINYTVIRANFHKLFLNEFSVLQ